MDPKKRQTAEDIFLKSRIGLATLCDVDGFETVGLIGFNPFLARVEIFMCSTATIMSGDLLIKTMQEAGESRKSEMLDMLKGNLATGAGAASAATAPAPFLVNSHRN